MGRCGRRHHSAPDFICVVRGRRPGEFFERKRGTGTDVADGRLARHGSVCSGGISFLSCRVIAGRKLAATWRRKRSRSRPGVRRRHPRVHLDDRGGRLRVTRTARRSSRRVATRLAQGSRKALAMIGIPAGRHVCTAATVIESPVCPPIGSRFSIEHALCSCPCCRTTSSESFPAIPFLDHTSAGVASPFSRLERR